MSRPLNFKLQGGYLGHGRPLYSTAISPTQWLRNPGRSIIRDPEQPRAPSGATIAYNEARKNMSTRFTMVHKKDQKSLPILNWGAYSTPQSPC